MGRFATTASRYEHLRPSYPPEFFREVAARLALARTSALIDLGTGPGLLALGFAPYVGRIVGVDPEPDMLEAARRAATRAGRDLTLIESTAEMLPPDIGTFDVVTIGRALHWMDRALTLALFGRLVAPDGAVVVCASFSVPGTRNPWLDDYNAVRRSWSPAGLWEESGRGAKTHRDLPNFFRDSAFAPIDVVRVETTHAISVADLAQRVLTFSSSSPEALGDNVDAMLRDVETRLRPFSHNGLVIETLVATAEIVKR
jgi:ubiquinone/menaquinone biosynthesis C-methylase UbiE